MKEILLNDPPTTIHIDKVPRIKQAWQGESSNHKPMT